MNRLFIHHEPKFLPPNWHWFMYTHFYRLNSNVYTPGTQLTPVLIGVWAFFWRVVSPQNRGHFQVPGSTYMGVSKNSGTPKSSILIEFSIINHPLWGIPIFGNTHIIQGLDETCWKSQFQSFQKLRKLVFFHLNLQVEVSHPIILRALERFKAPTQKNLKVVKTWFLFGKKIRKLFLIKKHLHQTKIF